MIYIVDDDLMVRNATSFELEAAGYRTRTFESGTAFLQEAEELPAGCLLLDLRMPELGGLGVLEVLKERDLHFPTAIVTAHGDIGAAVAAMRLGAADLLEKPFEEKALFDMVDKLLEMNSEDRADACYQGDAIKLVARLGQREMTVIRGLVAGMTNNDIAHHIRCTVSEVETCRASAIDRLSARDVTDALRMARDAGLAPLT